MPNAPINAIAYFCEQFNVKSDRIATEYVHYDEESQLFLYSNAETWGDSHRISVESNEGLGCEILSLEGRNEEELITELARLFANLHFDKDAFTQAVQTRYKSDSSTTPKQKQNKKNKKKK